MKLVPDPSLRYGEVGFRDPDGTRRCAGCGCREDGHCKVCGCLTRKGERDECLCAQFVATIQMCPHCGTMFGARWRLQNHLMPVPACQIGARAAAGRHAERPDFAPPLAAHRDKYARM